MAAGLSKRMEGSNKLLAQARGKPLIEHVLKTVLAADVSECIIVTGPHHEEMKACLTTHPALRIIQNRDYRQGLSSSIRTGVEAASSDAHAFMILLADMPLVKASTLQTLIAVSLKSKPGKIIVPIFQKRRGNPVIFSSTFRKVLCQLEGDKGAGLIIDNNAHDVVAVQVEDNGILLDVDTLDDLEQLDVAVSQTDH